MKNKSINSFFSRCDVGGKNAGSTPKKLVGFVGFEGLFDFECEVL